MSKSVVGSLSVLLVVVLFAGCGGGATKGRAAVFRTTGKVTYLGSPVIGATVTFAPQEKQRAAHGRTNDNGEFVLSTYGGGDGAAAGAYKVMVSLIESASEPAPADAHSADPSASLPAASHSSTSAKSAGSLLPDKFSDVAQTPLEAKIDPNGNNNFTFDLK